MLLGSIWVGDVIATLTVTHAGEETGRAIRGVLPEAAGGADVSILCRRPPARPRGRPAASYAPLAVWHGDETTWFAAPDLGRGAVRKHELWMLAVPGAAARFVRLALPFAVGPWLAPGERFALHAGCIASGDAGVLVLGRSGAGKSTFVVGALEVGAQPLSDDTSFLLPAARLAGLGRRVCATREAIPKRLHSDARPVADARDRVELDIPRLTGGVSHTGTVIVEHGSARDSELATAGASDVVREIALSSYLIGDPRSRAALLRRAAEAARPPAFRLRLGTEPTMWANAVELVLTGLR